MDMMGNKDIIAKNEFKRICNNIPELYRRINDTTNKYPKKLCCIWFVAYFQTLTTDDTFKYMLEKVDCIDKFISMINNVINCEYIRPDDKEDLLESLKVLKNINNINNIQKN